VEAFAPGSRRPAGLRVAVLALILSVGGAAVGTGAAGSAARYMPPIPRARTLAPIGVHPTNAVMVGAVDARGGFANLKFEIGRTTRYGKTPELSEEDVVVGSGYRKVTEGVTRLKQGTTYHYRIIASNRSGFDVGRDCSFTTPLRSSPNRLATAHCG
jgi:hypothetical protein